MNTRSVRRWSCCVALAGGAIVLAGAPGAGPARAETSKPGINVVLRNAVSDASLAELGLHGTVLDVIPQIRGVTMKADLSELPAIQQLPCVASADVDCEVEPAGTSPLPVADLAAVGANEFNLDVVNVTDYGVGRTVAYDGAGVYIAVIDTGLPQNWREYFSEQRIATQYARGFTGGGGEAHVISSQPDKWGKDTAGHGQTIVSVILGFAYSDPDTFMPRYINGVAPKANVIPIRFGGDNGSGRWELIAAHAIVYVADLKAGALGGAPVVINLSNGLHRPLLMERAAIQYAISKGVIVVAAAGNEDVRGMRSPAQYPEVISVAATGITTQLPADDPTQYHWILRDVPENDASIHYIAPFSSRQLAGQQLDVAAPGFPIPTAYTVNGVSYTFAFGTSQATPHVAGVAALMLQKNPTLVQSQVESILKSSAKPLAAGTVTVPWVAVPSMNQMQTWDRHDKVSLTTLTTSWGADATGAGLLQANAALAATPNP